jgi:hypothetical protein
MASRIAALLNLYMYGKKQAMAGRLHEFLVTIINSHKYLTK